MIIYDWIELNQLSELRSITTIPLPALTICPETKAKKSIIDISRSYLALSTKNDSLLNEDEYVTVYYNQHRRSLLTFDSQSISHFSLKNLEALSQVCDPHLFIKPLQTTATSGNAFVKILNEVAVDNFVLFCKFRNEIINCTEYFKDIVTSEGICKTFHMDGMKALPGGNYGLNVVLSTSRNDTDYICKGPGQGFKYKVHPSNEFPNFQHSFDRVPMKSDVMTTIHPKLTFNLDSSCSVEPQSECLRNCFASYLLSRCECVSFHMPHDDETSICNQHENLCVQKATDEFSINFTLSSEFPCDCRPSCESIAYETSSNFGEYDFANVIRAYNEDLDGEFPTIDMSRLTIYFDEMYVIPTVIGSKSLLSMIAQIGGILAFFLGASTLSIMELCYVLAKNRKHSVM